MKKNTTHSNTSKPKGRLNITLPQSVLDQLEEVSTARGLSKSTLLTLAWQAYAGISTNGEIDVKEKHE